MSGHVEVQVTGVGAFVAPASGGKRRPYRTGDLIVVTAEVAEQLIRDGGAKYPGEVEAHEASSDSADQAAGNGDASESETGEGTEEVVEFIPEGMTIQEMLDFAAEHELALPEDLDRDHRAPVIEAIETAIEEEDED
jgi:hypothetical protein